MTETCATCKYIRTLYVPPVDSLKDIPKDKYVCIFFEGEGQVMYLDYDNGMCELYTPNGERKEKVISRFIEDGVLYEQIIRETKIDADKAEGVSDADQTRKQKPLSF